MTATFQHFDALDELTIDELRESIREHGVVVPIIRDSYGRIIDGHHRAQIADELDVECPAVTLDDIDDDEQLHQLAVDLNTVRRHLTPAQRQTLVKELRENGHSLRSIATAVGVSPSTAANDVTKLEADGDLEQPERIKGRDGRSQPSSKPVKPTSHDVPAPAPSDGETRSEPLKQRLGHPARFSAGILDQFADSIERYLDPFADVDAIRVLDPFAGVGTIHKLALPHALETTGIEIERKWFDEAARLGPTIHGDALKVMAGDDFGRFQVVATSPTYANRMADTYTDDTHRSTYRAMLGEDLTEGTSASMNWGDDYRAFHAEAWRLAVDVLVPGGLLILNVSDHIRQGERVPVTAFHHRVLTDCDMTLVDVLAYKPRQRRDCGRPSPRRRRHLTHGLVLAH